MADRYVLRCSAKNGTSYNGKFQWPESGMVEAPDWDPTEECGHGLHGCLDGEGDDLLQDDLWQIVRVQEEDLIHLGDAKVKFPRGEVVLSTLSRMEAVTRFRQLVGDKAHIFSAIEIDPDKPEINVGDRSLVWGKGINTSIHGGSRTWVNNRKDIFPVVGEFSDVCVQNRCHVDCAVGSQNTFKAGSENFIEIWLVGKAQICDSNFMSCHFFTDSKVTKESRMLVADDFNHLVLMGQDGQVKAGNQNVLDVEGYNIQVSVGYSNMIRSGSPVDIIAGDGNTIQLTGAPSLGKIEAGSNTTIILQNRPPCLIKKGLKFKVGAESIVRLATGKILKPKPDTWYFLGESRLTETTEDSESINTEFLREATVFASNDTGTFDLANVPLVRAVPLLEDVEKP